MYQEVLLVHQYQYQYTSYVPYRYRSPTLVCVSSYAVLIYYTRLYSCALPRATAVLQLKIIRSQCAHIARNRSTRIRPASPTADRQVVRRLYSTRILSMVYAAAYSARGYMQ